LTPRRLQRLPKRHLLLLLLPRLQAARVLLPLPQFQQV
jgi:hypothetical protein